jgi:hypothetical protein
MTDKAPAAEKQARPKAPAAEKQASGRREERKPIETTTPRGDWVDPFSGLTVAMGNEVNPTNGARREGDEAVIWVND